MAVERNQRSVRNLTRDWKRRVALKRTRSSPPVLPSALAPAHWFCVLHFSLAMGGKGRRRGKGIATSPRWHSAVPGESPWVMWSPCDIPEWTGRRPEVEAVHLFPKTPDTPQGMEDQAQDTDQWGVTRENME